ncbi:hypothetical protein GCM10010424_48860 [Streptomyces lienomycini]
MYDQMLSIGTLPFPPVSVTTVGPGGRNGPDRLHSSRYPAEADAFGSGGPFGGGVVRTGRAAGSRPLRRAPSGGTCSTG